MILKFTCIIIIIFKFYNSHHLLSPYKIPRSHLHLHPYKIRTYFPRVAVHGGARIKTRGLVLLNSSSSPEPYSSFRTPSSILEATGPVRNEPGFSLHLLHHLGSQ